MGTQLLKDDKEAQSKLPKVMQDKFKNPGPSGTRSFSTSARQMMDMGLVQETGAQPPVIPPGFKFPPPTLPLPKHSHFRFRYDPIVNQVTNLLMHHGRKSVAQRVCHHSTISIDIGEMNSSLT